MTGLTNTSDGPQEPLRLGIVGCGHWARDAYLPNLVDCAEVTVTALCDREESRATALADAYSAPNTRPMIWSAGMSALQEVLP